MIRYDIWHTLEVEDGEYYLGGHGACPAYPNGPESDDIGYNCLTGYHFEFYGSDCFDEMKDLADGEYLIRYWSERSNSYFGSELEDGFEIKEKT